MTDATRSPDPDRLVFVAGLHRSGTTALARTLAGHPEVSGFAGTTAKEDEGQHLQDVYPSARAYGGAGRFALAPQAHLTEQSPLATPEHAARLLEQWSPYWDLSRRLLVEKSPPNLVMTRFLQALYPTAAFVVVVRHPVVVTLSSSRWTGPRAGLGRLLEHWLHAHELFWADAAHLRRVHVLAYEDLVDDPAGTLAGVADFLGLDGRVPTDPLQAGRSDRYREQWERLTHGHSPLGRGRAALLRRRYAARVQAFGYSFDDVDRHPVLPMLPRQGAA